MGVDGREEGLEDGRGKRFKVFGNFRLAIRVWAGKVVHDQLWIVRKGLSTTIDDFLPEEE